MTTEQLEAMVKVTDLMKAELEEAVKTGPEGSMRRANLAMATGWLVWFRGSLARALECES